jgi:hypothetical protein
MFCGRVYGDAYTRVVQAGRQAGVGGCVVSYLSPYSTVPLQDKYMDKFRIKDLGDQLSYHVLSAYFA